MIGIPDSARQRLLTYMNYNLLKNKTDKVQLYKEWYYKAYMVINERSIHIRKGCWKVILV